jgi:predicted RNase H-like nuclease (RuvC/YqgF family)
MDINGVQCQVCLRTPENRLAFYCHRCAQNTLYEPRLEQARSLLTNEALRREVESIIQEQKSQKISSEHQQVAVNRLDLEKLQSDVENAKARTRAVLDEHENLKEQIGLMKADIIKRRSDLKTRQAALEKAKERKIQDEGVSIKPLQQEIGSIEGSWDRLHKRTAEARMFLCREVATLYGLQRRRRKASANRDNYLIGGVPIIDLRDLNSMSSTYLLL